MVEPEYSTRPHRVQLSRKRGWRMPPNTVKVDRTTKWGNPFVIGDGPMGRHAIDHEGAVGFFRAMMGDPELRAAAGYPDDLSPLRGKNLACWCAGKWCHADVLLELANSVAEPIMCGGCGATSNDQRCMGCMHDFGTPDSAWVRKYHAVVIESEIERLGGGV